MAEAETTITQPPEPLTQEQLLQIFTLDYVEIASQKAADLLQAHHYLTSKEKFETIVSDLEGQAKEAGWGVDMVVLQAIASNVLVSAMMRTDAKLVIAYPVMPKEAGEPANDAGEQAQQEGEAAPPPTSPPPGAGPQDAVGTSLPNSGAVAATGSLPPPTEAAAVEASQEPPAAA